MDSNNTDPSIQRLNTNTTGQQSLQDLAIALLAGVQPQQGVDVEALNKQLASAEASRAQNTDWWNKSQHRGERDKLDAKIASLKTQITNAENFPSEGYQGLLTQPGASPDFSLAAGTTPLSAQAQRVGGQATSAGLGMIGGTNDAYALGMQGLGQISGNPYLQPFNTSAMDKYGKQIGGYQSDISSLQQGMGRYDTDIARYQEQISGYEAQQQQQAEAKAAAAAAKQTQIGEIQAKIDALNQGGQEEGSRGWGGRSNTASKIKEYEEQIAQIQRGDTQRSSGWGSSKDRRSTRDAEQAASDLERGMQSAQRSLSGLTSEQARGQSEIDRLTGLIGTAQGSYEEQQGLQGQWNQNNQQMYEQAQQNAQFNPQQFEQQFGGFDMNDYLNKVGGPMMESAFSTFGNRTIPMIANSFGAMDSARSSGMYDVLGRSAGEMMQGVYGQLAPQAFAAEQSSRDRMMTAEQSQKDRQLQAAQLQMTGGLGSQQLGIQGGLGMLDYGAQQAATAQQQAQAKATADFQKWQMEQPGMDPRLAMLLGQANQPAYSYIGMPGTQSPSTASQIAAPLASMYGDTGGLAGIMDLFKQK